jgi:hypothetical protein
MERRFLGRRARSLVIKLTAILENIEVVVKNATPLSHQIDSNLGKYRGCREKCYATCEAHLNIPSGQPTKKVHAQIWL